MLDQHQAVVRAGYDVLRHPERGQELTARAWIELGDGRGIEAQGVTLDPMALVVEQVGAARGQPGGGVRGGVVEPGVRAGRATG